MSDDEHLNTDGPDHFDMDEKFCARMRAAIAAGLESAPTGVVTTPGTKNPDTSRRSPGRKSHRSAPPSMFKRSVR